MGGEGEPRLEYLVLAVEAGAEDSLVIVRQGALRLQPVGIPLLHGLDLPYLGHIVHPGLVLLVQQQRIEVAPTVYLGRLDAVADAFVLGLDGDDGKSVDLHAVVLPEVGLGDGGGFLLRQGLRRLGAGAAIAAAGGESQGQQEDQGQKIRFFHTLSFPPLRGCHGFSLCSLVTLG